MRYRLFGTIGLACAVMLSTGIAVGQTKESGTSAGLTGKPVIYQPPQRGAPIGRTGGSTRGTTESRLTVEVLAPNHIGLSAVDQPVLYWYLSRAVTAPLEITIDTLDLSADGSLLEMTIDRGRPAGISSLALRDAGVRLKPGVTYRWSVAVVVDSAQRSNDTIASGTIEYVPPPAALARSVARADEETAARFYADHGYWYDALALLSRNVERRSDRRAQRANLLEQEGLAEPAAFERSARPRS
jgi:hypothetical protein